MVVGGLGFHGAREAPNWREAGRGKAGGRAKELGLVRSQQGVMQAHSNQPGTVTKGP